MPVEQSILVTSSDPEAVISSLVFSTNYSVNVQALNEHGEGPRSETVHVMTEPESKPIIMFWFCKLALYNFIFVVVSGITSTIIIFIDVTGIVLSLPLLLYA